MVAIKYMKMPNSCSRCDLNYDCCCCIITGTGFWDEDLPSGFDEFKARLPDCPLVEVKVDGELID